MSKNLRAFRLIVDFIESPDGTDSYEMPKDWRPITMEELALSKFGHETPDFIERRQFNWSNNAPPYDTKRIHATMYWYGDKTGVAFHKEWVYNPSQREGQWTMFYFAFGCKHQFKELSVEESRSRDILHFGNCYHVHECQLCKVIDSYDSSD